MDARMNIGPFKIVPGRARIVQTMRSPIRYVSKPRVFQLAFWARGTFLRASVIGRLLQL